MNNPDAFVMNIGSIPLTSAQVLGDTTSSAVSDSSVVQSDLTGQRRSRSSDGAEVTQIRRKKRKEYSSEVKNAAKGFKNFLYNVPYFAF